MELKQLQAACLWCVRDEYESPADSLRRSVKVKFVSVPLRVQNTSVTFQRFLLCSSCRLDTTTLSLWGQRSETCLLGDGQGQPRSKLQLYFHISCGIRSNVQKSFHNRNDQFKHAGRLPTGSTGTFPSVGGHFSVLMWPLQQASGGERNSPNTCIKRSSLPRQQTTLSPQRPQPADARLEETQILTCSHPLSLRLSQHSIDLLLCKQGVKTDDKSQLNAESQRVRGFSPDSPVWTHACEVSWWFLAACDRLTLHFTLWQLRQAPTSLRPCKRGRMDGKYI